MLPRNLLPNQSMRDTHGRVYKTMQKNGLDSVRLVNNQRVTVNAHADLKSLLLCSISFNYLFTSINRFTRLPIAIPTTSITAETVAKVFIHNCVTIIGKPIATTTDKETRFESELSNNLSKILSSNRIRYTVYHP